MKKMTGPIIFCLCAWLCIYLCTDFEAAAASVARGINTGVNILLPSLFPFFVISDLMIKLLSSHSGILSRLFSKIFNMPEGAFGAYICGIISGYPVGAAAACSLYEQGIVSKEEAERLICFTNNSGPLFIICAVGCGMLGNLRAGIIMYAVHILSSLITGIICGINIKSKTKSERKNTLTDIKFNPAESIEKGFFQCLKIIGFVIFFAIITDMILLYTAKTGLRYDNGIMAMIICLTEITNGAAITSANFDTPTAMCIISFGCSFSGLGILLQTALVTKSRLCLKKYVLYKLFAGFISFCLCRIVILASELDFTFVSDYRLNIVRLLCIGVCYILFTYYIIRKNKGLLR